MKATEHFPVALFQMNGIAADLEGNSRKILQAAQKAAQMGAVLLVTPEMSLTGGRLGDLLQSGDFRKRHEEVISDLSVRLGKFGIAVIVGTLFSRQGAQTSSLVLFEPGSGPRLLCERDLSCRDACAQARVEIGGKSVAVALADSARAISLAAPFDAEIHFSSEIFCGASEAAEKPGKACSGKPRLEVHAAGGFDSAVYLGGSCWRDKEGAVCGRLNFFEEDFALVDLLETAQTAKRPEQPDRLSMLYGALVAATRDYVVKNGFSEVTLGLSGGVDSALVATIAADALGPQNVHCVLMPTRFTGKDSLEDALELVRRRSLPYVITPIEPLFEAFLSALQPEFVGRSWDVTEENLQARVRGMLLMAYSNKFGRLVLTTGNKSECAVGYSTLYGDTAGAFAPICDVLKSDVWALCMWRNAQPDGPVIPEHIITRAPSAELREGQTDQQSLPPYETLDAIVRGYVEKRLQVREIAAGGIDEELVRKVIRMIHRAEYKRRQCPPGPRVSAVSFSSGWNYPLGLKV